MGKREFTTDEARQIGDQLGVDWAKFDIEQFRRGLEVEMEHGSQSGDETKVTQDYAVSLRNSGTTKQNRVAIMNLKPILNYRGSTYARR